MVLFLTKTHRNKGNHIYEYVLDAAKIKVKAEMAAIIWWLSPPQNPVLMADLGVVMENRGGNVASS